MSLICVTLFSIACWLLQRSEASYCLGLSLSLLNSLIASPSAFHLVMGCAREDSFSHSNLIDQSFKKGSCEIQCEHIGTAKLAKATSPTDLHQAIFELCLVASRMMRRVFGPIKSETGALIFSKIRMFHHFVSSFEWRHCHWIARTILE